MENRKELKPAESVGVEKTNEATNTFAQTDVEIILITINACLFLYVLFK